MAKFGANTAKIDALLKAAREECAKAGPTNGSECWALVYEVKDGALGACQDNEAASAMLKKTADGKASFLLEGGDPVTNPALAPCALLPYLCGCIGVLKLPGGKKFTTGGKEFIFVVSGWAGGAQDVEIMEASMKKAGL